MPCRAETLKACLLEKLLSKNQTGAGLYGYIAVGPLLSPLQAQTLLPWEEEKVPALLLQACRHHPNQRLFGSALPSPRYPPSCAQFHGREREQLRAGKVNPLEAMVWDQDKVLSSHLRAGPASLPMGDCFGLFP